MVEIKLVEKLKEAYEVTTYNHNAFKNVIDSIEWDNIFNADGETYFCKGKFSLIIENINPFKEMWKPTVFFSDGSMKEF